MISPGLAELLDAAVAEANELGWIDGDEFLQEMDQLIAELEASEV